MVFLSSIGHRTNTILGIIILSRMAHIALMADIGVAIWDSAVLACAVFLLDSIAILLILKTRYLIEKVDETVQVSVNEQSASYRIDAQTGVLTRAAFLESCRQSLKARKPGLGFLIHLDLDYLKTINDTHGHSAGDHALLQLCKAAQSADPDAILGRLGGDEFAMLVMHRPASEAKWLAGEVLGHLGHHRRFEGHALSLSASIGIASILDDSTRIDELLHMSDLALYASKRGGRARATHFDPAMLGESRQIRLVERELRAALLLDELHLDYQPVFDRTGKITGCEALVRWNHSVRGRIMPSDFIPVAEKSKLIDSLGEWVLRRACTDFAKIPALRVSVNVSAAQLKRDELVAMVKRVLDETKLPSSRLVLEITESMGVEQITEARKRIEALRALGIRISLDDFGAGHSGFSYLHSFPVDVIKIDRSFIAKLGTSHASTVLVGALVSVAHANQIEVVAEGIETTEQMNLAKQAGANFFQGFHLLRPTGLKAIERLALADARSGTHCERSTVAA